MTAQSRRVVIGAVMVPFGFVLVFERWNEQEKVTAT